MVNLKIPRRYLRKRDLFKMLIGLSDGFIFSFPNMTLDKKESLIIHSSEGAETSVAVMANDDGSLRVLFAPPITKTSFIEKRGDELTIDPVMSKILKGV
jgi:hypothetical protein